MVGGRYPKDRQIRSIRWRNAALAMCVQFQVNK
jgi:hypothetical protein